MKVIPIFNLQSPNVFMIGLRAMARAGDTKSCYLGHMGCGLIAAKLLVDEFEFSRKTRDEISNCLNVLVSRHPDLFHQFDDPDSDSIPARPLERYASTNAGVLCRSGHLGIASFYALKAAEQYGGNLPSKVVSGIENLFQSFQQEREQNRYFGYEKDYHTLPVHQSDQIPSFEDPLQATLLALRELELLYHDWEIDGSMYYFSGEKLHAITFGHSLCEHQASGRKELVMNGLESLRRQIKLNRMTPINLQNKWGSELETSHSPFDADFWRKVLCSDVQLAIPHAFKRAYSVLRVVQLAEIGSNLPTEHLIRRVWGVCTQ